MDETLNPWKTLSTKTQYENPWIRVEEHQVINAANKPGIYGTVHFKNLALGIVPVDNEGNTYLVGQYRYPLKQYSWEIPEGGGALEIEPLVSAQRELKEETGITAMEWRLIQEMHLSNSATDERALIYLATGLHFGDSAPEEDEALTVKKLPLKKATEMVLNGEITDAISVVALLRASALMS
ncbi:MAG: NUDIX hydrolase [Bdellovibrionaceae bacterium]|nr:NUDIX hydrolase [Pseudobdellovibrionaceae bacterium]